MTGSASPLPAAEVGQLADPDEEHDIPDGDERIEGLGQQDLVAEEPQEVVGAGGSVLHRLLDRHRDRSPVIVRADGTGGHALVQADDDRVQRDPECDHCHPA